MLIRTELTVNNTNYPKSLQTLGNHPTIYAIGNIDILNTPKVAVIGTRRPTPYGIACAEIAGSLLAKLKITHLTTAAIGCNKAAAKATIQEKGKLLAVTATGADIDYPQSSADIFDLARKQGLALSVSPWASPALPTRFSNRNELIAHLADAFIVCESGIPSGIITTAQKALALDKPVFAFPGSIFTRTATGSNELIANGAQIIVSEKNLQDKLTKLFKLDTKVSNTAHPYPIGMPDGIMAALLAQPMQLTDLATALNSEPTDITRQLITLEMNGSVIRLPNGAYSLTVQSYTKGSNHG